MRELEGQVNGVDWLFKLEFFLYATSVAYESASSLPRHSFYTLLRRPHGPLPAPSPSLADALES